MTLKEAIQKDGQRHLYVKSAITPGTPQYQIFVSINQILLTNKFCWVNEIILLN